MEHVVVRGYSPTMFYVSQGIGFLMTKDSRHTRIRFAFFASESMTICKFTIPFSRHGKVLFTANAILDWSWIPQKHQEWLINHTRACWWPQKEQHPQKPWCELHNGTCWRPEKEQAPMKITRSGQEIITSIRTHCSSSYWLKFVSDHTSRVFFCVPA